MTETDIPHERRRAAQLDQIRSLIGPFCLYPVADLTKLMAERARKERLLARADASALVVSFAAALNGDVVFGDNTLDTTMQKLRDLEGAVVDLREKLEAEQKDQ